MSAFLVWLVLVVLAACCLVLIVWVGNWWAEKNNPYSSRSWVKPFFITTLASDGQIIVTKRRDLHVLHTPFGKLLMYIQACFRIEGNVYHPEEPLKGNEQSIIDQIHQERFDPGKPYAITGGHFTELYVRDLGVFYPAMLDARIPTSLDDWLARQRVTLQTVATDLELLKQSRQEYTTFVPIGPHWFTTANFNTQPSDSLFAIVYTLLAAKDETFIARALPTANPVAAYPLQTRQAAQQLIASYQDVLSNAISQYLASVIDSRTGLIKKTIRLSGARDSMKRQSSFYDNVIAWATAKYATELAIPFSSPALYRGALSCDFAKWKQTIIDAFWDETEGLFLDDLSSSSIKNHIFTGEGFLVIPTHFFDQQNAEDRRKLLRMVQYVKKSNLDRPFPLFYAQEDQPRELYFLVRYFATSYMGKSIWSYIGQEYIKSLILLAHDLPELLQEAQRHLQRYRQNIEKYGGYPELYDENGEMFTTLFYKSVLHTGWVIGYEQAKMLLASAHS